MPARKPDLTDQVVNLSKRRGFVFPSAEIYGGSRSSWDYGPLGVELKENVKSGSGGRPTSRGRDDVVGLDSAVILPRAVWEASGPRRRHSVDPLVRVPVTVTSRFRADHLEEESYAEQGACHPAANGLERHPLPQLRDPRRSGPSRKLFNGHAASTLSGPGGGRVGVACTCVPETAQGIFRELRQRDGRPRGRSRRSGSAQTGKSFRNEITPGNFIFRTREFEQMELEFFVEPGTDETWHQHWMQERPHRLVHRTSVMRPGQPAASSSTPRRSCRTTPSGPSTSSTGSASPARSGASWRASPTAPTSTC